MPSCLHVLFHVACLLHSNRGCEGTVILGMFPQGCEDTVARSHLLCKGGGGVISDLGMLRVRWDVGGLRCQCCIRTLLSSGNAPDPE